jgi:hypothetical protein
MGELDKVYPPFEERFRRVERSDAYGELLSTGQAIVRISKIDDVDTWRSNLRRQARADRIKIRTGVTDNGLLAWAMPVDSRHGIDS